MLRKYGNFFPGASRSKKQEIKRTIFLPSVEWRVVAVAVSQRISQKENQSQLSRLFVKTNPTPVSVVRTLTSFHLLYIYSLLISNIGNIKNIENVIKFSNPPIFYKNVNIHIIGKIICVIFHTLKCRRIWEESSQNAIQGGW